MMRYTYALVLNRPRLILAILSLLVITEMGLAYFDTVPIKYEWLLGWLLFLTILAWMGMVGLTGVIAPVSSKAFLCMYASPLLVSSLLILSILVAPNSWFTWFSISTMTILPFVLAAIGAVAPANFSAKAYSILVAFPLILVAWLWLWWLLSSSPFGYVGWTVAVSYALAIPLLIGAVTLRTILAGRPRTRSLYIIVALAALGSWVAAIALPAVWFLDLATIPWIGMTFASLGGMVLWITIAVATVPGTTLIGTMRHPYRNIVVSAIGLWSVIMFIGWYWAWTMDDGLNAFAGKEREAAERVMQVASCDGRTTPMRRVVKDDNGRLVVEMHTWWRFSTTCDAMPKALWDG